jgi:hypothetical protein
MDRPTTGTTTGRTNARAPRRWGGRRLEGRFRGPTWAYVAVLLALPAVFRSDPAFAGECTGEQFAQDAFGSACVCPGTEYRVAYAGTGGDHCQDVSVTLYTVNTFSLTKRGSASGGSSQNTRGGSSSGTKSNPIQGSDKVAVKVECKAGDCAGKSKYVVGAGSGSSVPGVTVSSLTQCASDHEGCKP